MKYLEGNFPPLRAFRDLADLNAQARAWVMDETGVRCHGTTRQSPLALFALEAPLLKALPGRAPDLGTWHRVSVHRDCHVQFERVLYSAPFTLVGRLLWLRATDEAVALFEDYRHVATHARGRRPGQRVSVREHLPPEAQAVFGRNRAWCTAQAERVGPSCVALIEQLLSDHILERLRAAQGVLALLKPYGRDRLEAACARALAHTARPTTAPSRRSWPLVPTNASTCPWPRRRLTAAPASPDQPPSCSPSSSPTRSKTCCIDPEGVEP